MAQVDKSLIKIRRSSGSAVDALTIATGELAYTFGAGTDSNKGGRLFVGGPAGDGSLNGTGTEPVVIGGKYFTDMMDHTTGTLTASSAILVDSNSKIDTLKTTNLQIGGSSYDNYIRSTNEDGNIYIEPNGAGYVQIKGTNALIIPKGTDLQQAPEVSGAIRFNTDQTSFEGYDGTNWSSLGGVKSVDQLTYIKAEATPNNGDGTLYFNAKDGVTSVNVMTMDKDGLKIIAETVATGSNTGALQVAGGMSVEGDFYVQGALTATGNQNADSFLAAQGAPTGDGDTGFSFTGDGGNDTGMFSTGDGQLSLYSNDDIVLDIQSGSDVKLNADLKLGSDGYQVIGQTSSTFFVQPNTDDAATKLEFTLYSSNAVQLASDGGYGLLLGNVDSSDSYINIGGVDGSYWDSPDDIAIKAMRNGIIALRTNNNDITLQNDFGIVTFRNSDGHLVIPGTIESTANTGDVTLVASNGTERNLVFTGAGALTLPNNGIEFYDNNNSSGTLKGQISFDGEMYISSADDRVIIYANNSGGGTKAWSFETNGDTIFPDDGTLQLSYGAYGAPDNTFNNARIGLYGTNTNYAIGIENNYSWMIGQSGVKLYSGDYAVRLQADTNGVKINNAYTLPTIDGTANYVIQTDGEGSLSWVSDTITIGDTDVALGGTVTTITGLDDVTIGNINIAGNTISATNAGTDANVVLEPIGAGYVDASNAQIKNVAEPTNDTDAATKYYVDAARSGLDVKQSVRLATTVDIALTGVKTVDTKTTVTGDRILVKNQDTAADNGIYVANDAGAWTRATDFDQNTEVTSGAFTFVEDGSVNINAGFVVTTKVVDVGTTAIDWTLFSASGTLIAGDGLSKDGYTLKVNTATDGGIEISGDSLQLKSTVAGNGLTLTTGVLAVGGTANRISVDANSVDISTDYVGQSSITTVSSTTGITTGAWKATIIDPTYGGTGVNNGSKTITLGGNLTTSGAYNTTFTMSAATSVTFPTTGTLATLAGTEDLTNKTINSSSIGATTRSSGAFTTLAANNLVTFTDTTEAGPLGTASVVMSGGLSVAKKIYAGGDIKGTGSTAIDGFVIDGGTW